MPSTSNVLSPTNTNPYKSLNTQVPYGAFGSTQAAPSVSKFRLEEVVKQAFMDAGQEEDAARTQARAILNTSITSDSNGTSTLALEAFSQTLSKNGLNAKNIYSGLKALDEATSNISTLDPEKLAYTVTSNLSNTLGLTFDTVKTAITGDSGLLDTSKLQSFFETNAEQLRTLSSKSGLTYNEAGTPVGATRYRGSFIDLVA